MTLIKTFLRWALYASLSAFMLAIVGVIGTYYYLAPSLPDTQSLRDLKLQVPLRIYSRDGLLIAEYGDTKRIPLRFDEFPPQLVHAFLAAEDDRFFEHPGVDYQGLLRAAWTVMSTGQMQGGSTITMQVARNVFLSSEQTLSRKVREIFLSLRIEDELTKEEILELYLNKIFLGHRSYGVAAAAQVYYGKELNELTLAQIAMIAGLPKAPSKYNPIANPERALLRRNYVLRRMHELDYITQEEFDSALQQPVTAQRHAAQIEVEAPYIAEMVRAEMVARFGEADAFSAGYQVYTTLNSRLQTAANQAVRGNLLDYDRRHGWRGAESHVELGEQDGAEQWDGHLAEVGTFGGLSPAVVVALEEQAAAIYVKGAGLQRLEWPAFSWAKPYKTHDYVGQAPRLASDVLAVGDIIRTYQAEEGWQLAQLPQPSAALVSLNPRDGSILALVGGFDYYYSKFNRATQAERQPGSNFKPFIYAAALDAGYTPASIFNDAPVVFEDSQLEDKWRPENYSGKFYGPTRLREALVNSRNLVSIRLLRAIGINYAIDYLGNFGFTEEKLPRNLSLSLGSANVTPLEVVRGYAVFANGGYLIEPYFIERVENSEGEVLIQADPLVVCGEVEVDCQARQHAITSRAVDATAGPETDTATAAEPDSGMPPPRLAPRKLDERTVYLITSMMRDVITRGTGAEAYRKLGRNDMAGKTGTTNEQRDAWFSGFTTEVVTTAWVGFDTPAPLGRGETGGHAALPMWITYMREALKGLPEKTLPEPEGMVTVRIDPLTGELAAADQQDAIFETFREENVPQTTAMPGSSDGNGSDEGAPAMPHSIF